MELITDLESKQQYTWHHVSQKLKSAAVPSPMEELLKKMLVHDPKKRLGIDKVIAYLKAM